MKHQRQDYLSIWKFLPKKKLAIRGSLSKREKTGRLDLGSSNLRELLVLEARKAW